MSAEVIWHEVENGAYADDLSLWEELAAEAGGSVLELGCGTGRVSTHLARRGHEVTGIDSDAELIAGLDSAVLADAREFELGRRFELILAPMQLIQLLGEAGERRACLHRVAAHLAPDGLAAFAIVEAMPAPVDAPPPLPDTRETGGWVYSSLPLDAATGGGEIRVRRLRQTVSPSGELAEELHEIGLRELDAATLEAEAATAGLAPTGRRAIPAGEAHIGSTVVLLRGVG